MTNSNKRDSVFFGAKNHKSKYIAGFIMGAFVLLASMPIGAARIYNDMSFPIIVYASVNTAGAVFSGGATMLANQNIVIQPGAKSDSLDWKLITKLDIKNYNDQSKAVCDFDFGLNAQVQGGNYGIIGPNSCQFFDSNKQVIATGTMHTSSTAVPEPAAAPAEEGVEEE